MLPGRTGVGLPIAAYHEAAIVLSGVSCSQRRRKMFGSTRISLIMRTCLALAAAALFASDARAQFDGGAVGGWTGLPDQTITVPGLFSTILRFISGFNAGVRLGYELGAWRLDEEYGYR